MIVTHCIHMHNYLDLCAKSRVPQIGLCHLQPKAFTIRTMYTQAFSCTCTHTNTHAHTCMCGCTHTHMHSHMQNDQSKCVANVDVLISSVYTCILDIAWKLRNKMLGKEVCEVCMSVVIMQKVQSSADFLFSLALSLSLSLSPPPPPPPPPPPFVFFCFSYN